MNIIEIEGIVINSFKYKENSEIITVLGENEVYSIICKGSLKLKSKLRILTDKLTYAKFNIYYKQSKLSTLIDGEIINNFKNIHLDLKRMSYSLFLLDIFNQITKEDFSNKFYDLLKTALLKINDNINPLVISDMVLVKLLPFIGLSLNLEKKCIFCNSPEIYALSIEESAYVCHKCYLSTHIKMEKEALDTIYVYQNIPLHKVTKTSVSDNTIKTIDKFIKLYYETYSGLYLKNMDYLSNLSI